MTVRILEGDCREMLRTLSDESVHSIVTDPPYELGFMGKAWDSSGIAYDQAVWIECLRVLKPGGHLLAFGGTRTYHRLGCAIEDAGFDIRDQIGWLYGSGFPKSHNGPWGGTALKPAWEPIVMARKPLNGTVEANWRGHGTGALNIDGCRVDPTGESRARVGEASQDNRYTDAGGTNFAAKPGVRGGDPSGRWPANVIHDGSIEVEDAFAAFGQKASGQPCGQKAGGQGNVFGHFAGGIPVTGYGDAGSASRFFYCAKASREDRNVGCDDLPEKALNWSSGEQSPGTFQSPNTNRAARNNHPTVKPTELMRYLVRLVTPPGGVVLDPFAGSGSTGRAADIEGFSAILIELNPEYAAIARRRIHGDAPLFAEIA